MPSEPSDATAAVAATAEHEGVVEVLTLRFDGIDIGEALTALAHAARRVEYLFRGATRLRVFQRLTRTPSNKFVVVLVEHRSRTAYDVFSETDRPLGHLWLQDDMVLRTARFESAEVLVPSTFGSTLLNERS